MHDDAPLELLIERGLDERQGRRDADAGGQADDRSIGSGLVERYEVSARSRDAHGRANAQTVEGVRGEATFRLALDRDAQAWLPSR